MNHYSDYVGYIASAIVLFSFLMKKMKNLRILNSIGCLAFIIYGALIDAVPLIITNVAIVLIHLYYLSGSRKGN